METKPAQIPAGPQEEYRVTDDLLEWIGRQFTVFGDIYKASIYGCSAYVIRNPEFAYHVLVRNWQNYVKGMMIQRVALLLGNGLMVSEGEVWKRQRRMIQPTFNHPSIAPLMKLITSVNSELLKKWQLAAQRNENINVTRDVSSMALEVVLRFIFGDDYEEVGSHFDLLFKEQVRNVAFARSFRALGSIVLRVVDRRLKNPSPSTDALGMLMKARDPESGRLMERGQLLDEIFTLIVAGHETTASTLNWTWYLLSQHPEVEQHLSREINLTSFSEFDDLSKFVYARQIIDEAMRLYPAGWLLTRKALRDDWLGDYFVPAGTEIYLPPYFIQRNPNLWEEPDRFDPDRFRIESSKRRHRLATIPFSAGPRNCIGEHLARMEMLIHLIVIARYLRVRHIQSEPIALDAGVNLRSKNDFVMRPQIK